MPHNPGKTCADAGQIVALATRHWTVALKTKSLARNHKTGCSWSGSASAPPSTYSRLGQHRLTAPTMNRDDALIWLSLFWFVALCGAAIWVLLQP